MLPNFENAHKVILISPGEKQREAGCESQRWAGRELVRLAARGRGVPSRCFCLKSLSGRIAASLWCVSGGLPPLSHAPVRFAAAAGLKERCVRVRETHNFNLTAGMDGSMLMRMPLKKGRWNYIDFIPNLEKTNRILKLISLIAVGMFVWLKLRGDRYLKPQICFCVHEANMINK